MGPACLRVIQLQPSDRRTVAASIRGSCAVCAGPARLGDGVGSANGRPELAVVVVWVCRRAELDRASQEAELALAGSHRSRGEQRLAGLQRLTVFLSS